MTQQYLRPEAEISQHHWWRLFADIRAGIARLDARDSQRGTLQLMIDEYGSASAATQLSVGPQTNNPVLITSMFVVCSAAAGTVQIEDRAIPVVQGTTSFMGLSLIRREARPATLTTATPGNLYMELMGYEFPRIVD